MDISVIVPVYNEVRYIDDLMNDLLGNDISISGRDLTVEYIIIDGGSNDGTLEKLQKYRNVDSNVKLIHNPKRYQVHALNIGIELAAGDYIIRCDSHSRYPSCYFKTLYNYLIANPDVGNVGMRSVTVPGDETLEALVVSEILASKFGVGSSHRNIVSEKPIEVDTVLFGAWNKQIFNEAGVFDENFIRGQDYEHNCRIKKLRKKVVLIPDGEFRYITRTKLSKMFKMIFQYAHAKINILNKHKQIPGVRSMIPVLLWTFVILSVFMPIFFIPVFVYLVAVIIVSFRMSFRHGFKSFFMFFAGYLGIHLSYFLGFCKGILDYLILKRGRVAMDHSR